LTQSTWALLLLALIIGLLAWAFQTLGADAVPWRSFPTDLRYFSPNGSARSRWS
jgi:hypothetical protein